MSKPSNQLPFVRLRRIATLMAATPMSLIAIWTTVTIQGSFAVAAVIAVVGFIVSFIVDGRLLYADLTLHTRIRQLLMLQGISVTVASAIIIYVWSGAATLVCLSGCSEARIAQVDAEALGFAVILSVIAGLLFLAPSLSVWRRVR
jgi:hypothetical protein